MRKPALSILLFAVFCCFLVAEEAKAQTAYGISAIQYDDSRNIVDAYSVTELDYYAGYYYDPYVEGYLYRGNALASSGYSLGYANYISAVVHTSATATPGTQFTLESDHYVVAYYYYYSCFYGCGYYYYDYWGYRFAPGGGYGGYYGFPGFSSPAYLMQRYYYLGTTAVQITTQSQCHYDDDGFAFAPGGGTPSSSCVLVPTLEGPASVTRGSGATFTIRNAARNAQISWRFNSDLGSASRVGGTTWAGTMVVGGLVTATVIQGGRTHTLQKAISVNNRDNFALPALPTTKVANGSTIGDEVLRVPDVPTGSSDNAIGKYRIYLPSSVLTAQIGDGPNAGFKYVTSLTHRSGAIYAYVISPALEDTNSEFYRAQCGNYNPQTDTGFISGADLLANTIRHEAGSVQSHYRNYVDALADSSKNPGTVAEKIVAGPAGGNATDFLNNVVSPQLDASFSAIINATAVEPCGVSDVRLNAACQKSGNINFAPYQSCSTTPPGGGTVNGVSFVSQSVPYMMAAGAAYVVSVTLRNSGTSTWTDAGQYRLGSQNPRDNYVWGFNRVSLPSSIPPGGDVTFSFHVNAPTIPGSYNFQWQMVQDGVAWFGPLTPNILVDVYSLNYCDWWQEQDCYNRGGYWDSYSCTCYGGYYYPY